MGDRNDLVERHHRSLGGRPAPGSAGERHSISMTSDQHHLLAVMSTPPGAKSRCSSVVLEIAAARRDEHRQVDGTQREMVFVRFNTLAWPLTLPAPDGGRRGPSLESRVTG